MGNENQQKDMNVQNSDKGWGGQEDNESAVKGSKESNANMDQIKIIEEENSRKTEGINNDKPSARERTWNKNKKKKIKVLFKPVQSEESSRKYPTKTLKIVQHDLYETTTEGQNQLNWVEEQLGNHERNSEMACSKEVVAKTGGENMN